ncbi:MAG TPA: CARDB domain-containing protein [Gemmatimonadaceae bacterium]
MRYVLRLELRSLAGVLLPAVLACTDADRGSILGPSASSSIAGAQGIDVAIAAQQRHTAALMRIPGVVGTSVGVNAAGQAVVQIYLADASVSGLPDVLDGVPVRRQVTGRFMAYSDPTQRLRPAPIGYSVGHFAITAGTIGARVLDAASNIFLLSNNHVLANSNDAAIGDAILQPGPVDGGTAADQIGTLAAFQAIDFAGGNNTIDAALATANATVLDNTTPPDDGYGMPAAQIWGDGNGDGTFDNKNALLNLNLQKYGRTTKLTKGAVTGINATLSICYEQLWIFCIKSATFVDQIVIEPGAFSGGGDSGSLIVTDDANRNPVALLFAGSTAQTIANRIDLVLDRFDVRIDAGTGPPPPPADLLDVAIQGVSGPGSVTSGHSADIVVTITNIGNQNAATAFDVSLRDATDNVEIGTGSIASLAVGATTTRTFTWNTGGRSIGAHTLTALHTFSDENAANDQASTVVTVNPQSTGMHVGNLTAIVTDGGTSWSAIVEIEVHDAAHNALNGATVVGSWTPPGLNSNTCTTGDGGGNGTCIVLYPGISSKRKSVSFSVSSLTKSLYTYASGSNHDTDGGSNGTTIKVNRP